MSLAPDARLGPCEIADQIGVGRMREIYRAIGPLVSLASRASSCVTGLEIVVDGGITAR
jgi:hypothetical protein